MIESKTSRLQVMAWTKDGWTKKVTDPVVINNPRPYHETSDFENQNYGMYALLANITDKIQAGNPATEVDALPQNIRRMYEENGPIFLGDYGVYRKLDEVEQAYQGDYGLYDEDSDEVSDNIRESVFAAENYNFERHQSSLQAAEDDDNDILTVMTEEQMFPVNQDYITNVLEASYSDTEGYRSPKEKVDNIEKKYFSGQTISSHEREERFKELFEELTFCKTKVDIWGVPKEELDGSVSFSGGFMERVRPYYQKDKELIQKWSQEAKAAARRNFIKEFRNQRKESGSVTYNEEKLRKILYMKFDKVIEEHSIKPDMGGGVEEVRASKGSQWDIDKSRAFEELYLTRAQWNALYKMKDTVLHRIDLQYKNDPIRDQIMKDLRAGWKDIKTRADLVDYIQGATARKWKYTKTTVSGTTPEVISVKGEDKLFERKNFQSQNTYDFEPSLIDQISIKDEFNWKQALRKKGRELGHYSIPVRFNLKDGKKKDEFVQQMETIVKNKIRLLKASKDYNKDKTIINRLINEYNLDISIN